jgi:lipocalin
MSVGVLAGFIIGGCLGMPNNVLPVSDFELNRYLGRWYEIARLDHSFEQSLENVTAEYSIRKDGGVNVVNRGFSTENREWSEANDKAYFVKSVEEGLFLWSVLRLLRNIRTRQGKLSVCVCIRPRLILSMAIIKNSKSIR